MSQSMDIDKMSRNVHYCDLRLRDSSGFSKLPPNASWLKRLARSIRKMSAINPNHVKCKEYFRNKSSQAIEQRRYVQSSHFFVIHPFSRVSSFVEFMFFAMWLYSILMYPLIIFAVHVIPLVRYTITAIQGLLVFMLFFIGYIDKTTREIVIKPKLIVWNYLTSYFLVDFIAIGIPFAALQYFTPIHFVAESLDVQYNAIMNIICMFCYSVRIETVLRYLEHITKFLKLPKRLQLLAIYMLKTFIFVHIFSCFLYGFPKIVNHGKWQKNSWVYQAGIHKAGFWRKYMECLLIAVCYFFGASHGMYEVSDPVEQLSLSVITLFGRLYTLFMLADLLKIFGIVGVSRSKYEQQLSQLDEYMVSKNLPEDLRKRILKFYEHKLQRNFFNEPAILATLSDNLRTEMFLFSARKLIQKVYVLRIISKENLGNLIASMKIQVYSPNEIIMKSESASENIYFISSGTAAIFNTNGVELYHLEDGDEFGIINCLPKSRGQYLVKAIEATEVFYIDKVTFFNLLDEHPKAMKFYQQSVKNRISILRSIEDIARKGGVDFLSELRTGQILESNKMRPNVSH